MAAKIQTAPLSAIPPAPRHAITVHLPTWETMLKFVDGDPEIVNNFKSMYPRMFIHQDVKTLISKITELIKSKGQMCLLFSRPESAEECKAFATSPARGKDVIAESDITIRVFDLNIRLYAVLFPLDGKPAGWPFWVHTGTGISSRCAEECLKHLDLLHEVLQDEPPPKVEEVLAQNQVRERIATLLERAPTGPSRKLNVSLGDVYLFKNGMASIYTVHKFLTNKYNAKSVLFGFAFHSTPLVLETFYGQGSKFFPRGTAGELDELESYLKSEAKEGRKIQALWTEFPANPLLATPDLTKLRKLADEHKFILVVDETIGSFCNVDVLGVADIIVTSLTKSFSGYADLMGASAVLNPSSEKYSELKTLFTESYHNDFFNGDAEQLEKNSRDYMIRSAKLNSNAECLVNYLQEKVSDPTSTVSRVYYPTTSDTLANYQAYMRQPTEDFKPGYGCLFSIELETIEATIAFYESLNVHHGPHLGAHLTLTLPYVRAIYAARLDEVAEYGLDPRQIRISVGLEDQELLVKEFEIALKVADATRKKDALT